MQAERCPFYEPKDIFENVPKKVKQAGKKYEST
jgi:hypothetical protein